MLFGSGNPPFLISAIWNIGILLHKQATRNKHFDSECITWYIYDFAGDLRKTSTPYVGFLLQNIGWLDIWVLTFTASLILATIQVKSLE